MISERGWKLTCWMVVFTSLTLVTVALRFWALRVQRRELRIDDHLVVGALACLLALEGTTWWAIENGLGAHTDTLTPSQAAVQLKLLFSAGITWTLATVLCKLAVLWLYTQLFTTRRFKVAVYAVMSLTASYALIFIPIFLTRCAPLAAAWDANPVAQQTKCRPITRQEFASVSINMALDLVIVLLPLPVIWALRIPTRKKVFVSGMFGLGLIIVAVMAWRIQDTVASATEPDWNYNLYVTALQSHLELWLGIIAANLPTLAPLIARFVTPVVKSYFGSQSFQGPSTGGRYFRRTFGSGPPVGQRDSRLVSNAAEIPVELVPRPQPKHDKAGATSPSFNSHAIRRDVDIRVDLFDREMQPVPRDDDDDDDASVHV